MQQEENAATKKRFENYALYRAAPAGERILQIRDLCKVPPEGGSVGWNLLRPTRPAPAACLVRIEFTNFAASLMKYSSSTLIH